VEYLVKMGYCTGQQSQVRCIYQCIIIARPIGCKISAFGVYLLLKSMKYLMKQMTRTGEILGDIIGAFVTKAILRWEHRTREFVSFLVRLILMMLGTVTRLGALKILLLMILLKIG
jgi:hypothetical protein